MRSLKIPEKLRIEFATVEAIWGSSAETRRVDCLVLSWVKYEKQLRRLFSFFVYQHPEINEVEIDKIISVFADNRNLYPETFISSIEAIGVLPVKEIMGKRYDELWPEIERIKGYRNKIMHGQHTGQAIQSAQLEKDVILLVHWVSTLADASESAYGYDGLERKTYRAAKGAKKVNIQSYPFTNPEEFNAWLTETTSRKKG